MNVTAKDRATGKAASTRISVSSIGSEGELQESLERGGPDRAEPASKRGPEAGGAVEETSRDAAALVPVDSEPDDLDFDAPGAVDEGLDPDDEILELTDVLDSESDPREAHASCFEAPGTDLSGDDPADL